MQKRVLLICPHSALQVFGESKISVAIPHIPYVSLASLAGTLLSNNHTVQILDLSVSDDPFNELFRKLESFQPDFVGVTFTSGLSDEARRLAKYTKAYNNKIITIAGGAHPSVFPNEVVEKYSFDFAVFGEGENTLLDIISGLDPSTINGIAYRDSDNQVIVNEPRKLIENLDDLAFPAFHLYNIKQYHSPRITTKKSPTIAIETSRGCPFGCIYCSKHIFQRKIRFKSAKRVVDEMEMVLNLGYKEIHIWDDCFSAVLDHPKQICDEILRRKLKVCWNVYNGIRVDRVDEELLRKLKVAGCYRVSFGIESGDQEILDRVGKGIKLDQIKEAARLAKKVNIETLGFFMIGLPGETKETIQKTIDLAKEIDLDLPKAGIATPLPGTPFFNEWKEKGLIRSFNWSEYVLHSTKRVAGHPNLSDKEILDMYDSFYRQLYLRPKFIWRRFWQGIKTGDIFFDIYYFFKVFLNFKW